jgi:uncharacterized membrane protein
MINLLFLAVIFGFAGFLVETISKSLYAKHFVYAGDQFFWSIPFLPIYSAGGLLMHLVMKFFLGFPWYQTLAITWIVVCLWEYIAGFFCQHTLHKKFWDYSDHKINLHGYICARNSLFWLLMVILYYFLLFSKVDAFLMSS